MDLLTKRQQYMQSLEQINQAMQRLEQQFSELQIQKERTIGALLMLDELLKSDNSEQPTLGESSPATTPPVGTSPTPAPPAR